MPRKSRVEEEVVLTIDVGGSGVKVSAYDVANHRSLGRLTGPYKDTSWNRDRSEYDLTSWWGTIAQTVGCLVERLDRPQAVYAGVTVGAIRIPFVLLDADSNIVRPAIANWDRRAWAEAAELDLRFGARSLYHRTGHWAAPEFGLSKLLWLQRHEPETLGRARHLLQLHDWIIFKLSGAFVSEPSSAAMSQLVRADGADWADDILAEVGIPRALLPELTTAGTRVGVVRRDLGELACLAGAPVYLGGGDTQLSAINAGGLVADGLGPQSRVVVVAGSTVPVQMAVVGNVRPDGRSFPLLTSRQLLPGWGCYEANASSVGSNMWDLLRLDSLTGNELAQALHDEGFSLVDDDGDEVVLPIGNPEFDPEAWAADPRREITGIHRGVDGSAVYQAAVECGCFAIKRTVACLRDHTRGLSGPVTATGGLTDDPRWCQTLAEVMGESVTVPDLERTSGIGGASVVAGRSLWSTDDDEQSRMYQPTGADADRLRRTMARYLELYAAPPGSAVNDRIGCDASAR